MKMKRVMMPAVLGALLAATLATQAQPARDGSDGSTGSGGKMRSDSAGTTVVTVPLVILVPAQTQPDSQLYNGCWVQLKDKDAMQGKGSDLLTIVGTMHLPELKTPSGINWARKADSLQIGPKANVTIYADENYKGTSARLRSGQEVKDLNKELGFAKSIDSLKIACGK